MAETISMPKLGFDMAEGKLVRWVKKEGETVNKGEVLAEIETDKATVEVETTASGVVRKLIVDEGAVVPIGSPIAIVGTADEKIEESIHGSGGQGQGAQGSAPQEYGQMGSGTQRSGKNVEESRPAATSLTSVVVASPLAKRMAREGGVDLANIKGTGPGGRIVRRDIELALAGGAVRPAAVISPVVSTPIRPAAGDQIVPLTRLRQIIARRMAESKSSVPHFYVTHEYKVDALMALRQQFNAIVPEDQKVSVNDFIVKSVALTLLQFPNLNAAFNGTSVIRHAAVNVGVAVSVEGGLLTVVCRDADQKPLRQIAAELKGLAARAREGKVRPEDIEGSTFSISNLGMYDVENFSAILNPPEAGILAVGSARQVPVVVGGADGLQVELGIGWRMKATISVDHRTSDGAEAARFMQALAVYLEEPLRLLI
jgi:pyruvate dehydrogenase E2 component (dihydrolipoamide acetyltransferase)